MGVLKEAIKANSIAGQIKGLLIVALMIAGAIFSLYKQSKGENLSLFILVSLIELLLIVFCTYRVLNHKMSINDWLGNILTFGFILFFGLFVVIRVFPEVQMDATVYEFIVPFLEGVALSI